MQIVEIVLHFAVGQFAVDQVAEVVVVIAVAVVGFQAVVGDGRAIVIGQDIVRRVEGEHFVAGLGNPAQFVVLEMRRSCPLVGAVGQVAGAVVAVAAFDGGLAIARHYFGFAFAAFGQIVEGGDLPFQTTQGIEFVAAGEFTLCAEDFAVQLIAFDVGDDFVVEADLVQVAAAVIQVVDLSAVGQDGGGTVAVEVELIKNNAYGKGLLKMYFRRP